MSIYQVILVAIFAFQKCGPPVESLYLMLPQSLPDPHADSEKLIPRSSKEMQPSPKALASRYDDTLSNVIYIGPGVFFVSWTLRPK